MHLNSLLFIIVAFLKTTIIRSLWILNSFLHYQDHFFPQKSFCHKIINNATTVFAMKLCEIINALKQYLVTSAALNKAIIRRNGVPKFYSSIKFTSTTL